MYVIDWDYFQNDFSAKISFDLLKVRWSQNVFFSVVFRKIDFGDGDSWIQIFTHKFMWWLYFVDMILAEFGMSKKWL